MRMLLLLLLASILLKPARGQHTPQPYAPEIFKGFSSGAVCGFSPDGQTIYFVREDTLTKRLTLYQAQRADNRWDNPQKLPFSGEHNEVPA